MCTVFSNPHKSTWSETRSTEGNSLLVNGFSALSINTLQRIAWKLKNIALSICFIVIECKTIRAATKLTVPLKTYTGGIVWFSTVSWKLLLKMLSDYHLDIWPHKQISSSIPVYRNLQWNIFSIFWKDVSCLLWMAITRSGLNADRALCTGLTVSGNSCTSLYTNYGIEACGKCNGWWAAVVQERYSSLFKCRFTEWKTNEPFSQHTCAPQIRKYVGLYIIHYRFSAVIVAGGICFFHQKYQTMKMYQLFDEAPPIMVRITPPGWRPTSRQS